MPGFISAGIFCFTLAQNESCTRCSSQPLRRADRADRRRGELIRGDAFYWGSDGRGAARLRAGRLIYSFFVKYYVAGLTAGAVKG